MASRRPPSSASNHRPPTANRPTTASRPRTGRPTTGRPTTAAGGNGGIEQNGNGGAYWQEEIDEEEYYESDDEDVFAFVPRESGLRRRVSVGVSGCWRDKRKSTSKSKTTFCFSNHQLKVSFVLYFQSFSIYASRFTDPLFTHH